MNNRRNKAGMICMILGAVLVFSALALFVWNQWESRQASIFSERLLEQVLEYLQDNDADGKPISLNPYDTAMTEVEIDGYAYIGYLSIPSIGLELPVMSEWDYDRLKLAVCRYTGSTKSDDLVIAGHNYNTGHFGALKNLSIGDNVFFTDMDGVVSVYEVAALEVLLPENVEEMTAGEYDLTLFTCTYTVQSRLAVRCERVTAE